MIFKILLGMNPWVVSMVDDSGLPPSFHLPGSDISRAGFSIGWRF